MQCEAFSHFNLAFGFLRFDVGTLYGIWTQSYKAEEICLVLSINLIGNQFNRCFTIDPKLNNFLAMHCCIMYDFWSAVQVWHKCLQKVIIMMPQASMINFVVLSSCELGAAKRGINVGLKHCAYWYIPSQHLKCGFLFFINNKLLKTD